MSGHTWKGWSQRISIQSSTYSWGRSHLQVTAVLSGSRGKNKLTIMINWSTAKGWGIRLNLTWIIKTPGCPPTRWTALLWAKGMRKGDCTFHLYWESEVVLHVFTDTISFNLEASLEDREANWFAQTTQKSVLRFENMPNSKLMPFLQILLSTVFYILMIHTQFPYVDFLPRILHVLNHWVIADSLWPHGL